MGMLILGLEIWWDVEIKWEKILIKCLDDLIMHFVKS